MLLLALNLCVFLYCTFKIYSVIRLSSRKCVMNSVFSVLLTDVWNQTWVGCPLVTTALWSIWLYRLGQK